MPATSPKLIVLDEISPHISEHGKENMFDDLDDARMESTNAAISNILNDLKCIETVFLQQGFLTFFGGFPQYNVNNVPITIYHMLCPEVSNMTITFPIQKFLIRLTITFSIQKFMSILCLQSQKFL